MNKKVIFFFILMNIFLGSSLAYAQVSATLEGPIRTDDIRIRGSYTPTDAFSARVNLFRITVNNQRQAVGAGDGAGGTFDISLNRGISLLENENVEADVVIVARQGDAPQNRTTNRVPVTRGNIQQFDPTINLPVRAGDRVVRGRFDPQAYARIDHISLQQSNDPWTRLGLIWPDSQFGPGGILRQDGTFEINLYDGMNLAAGDAVTVIVEGEDAQGRNRVGAVDVVIGNGNPLIEAPIIEQPVRSEDRMVRGTYSGNYQRIRISIWQVTAQENLPRNQGWVERELGSMEVPSGQNARFAIPINQGLGFTDGVYPRMDVQRVQNGPWEMVRGSQVRVDEDLLEPRLEEPINPGQRVIRGTYNPNYPRASFVAMLHSVERNGGFISGFSQQIPNGNRVEGQNGRFEIPLPENINLAPTDRIQVSMEASDPHGDPHYSQTQMVMVGGNLEPLERPVIDRPSPL
ncbi:MAG: hypothetical protein NUV91_07950, partial [Candidatus Omnitrophica bacterium]|nr:hypothetical protein [Candidatus Omnitrophota bacterium]